MKELLLGQELPDVASNVTEGFHAKPKPQVNGPSKQEDKDRRQYPRGGGKQRQRGRVKRK